MSRILVIAPQRILQQGIVFSLFPDHEVQSRTGLEATGSLAVEDFDLVIVDAAVVWDGKTPDTQLLREIREEKIPTLWIEEAVGHPAPRGNHRVVLELPIRKDTLQSAVAACLASSDSKPNTPRTVSAKNETRSKKRPVKESSIEGVSRATRAPIIELVDVVEEGPEASQGSTGERKTK